MFYQPELDFKLEEVIVYLRKSRSDDPLLSVEDVLSKHETILDKWSINHLSGKVPEENKYREIVSGETIADRPEINNVLKRIESPRIKAILCVEVQRLSRGDLEDAGRLIKLLRYTNTVVITPQKTYDLQNEYDRDLFERELKRGNEFLEYQKKIMGRGRLLSVSQGNYIGSIPPYGYEKTIIMEDKRKCHTLKINEAEADVVRMIFDMYVHKNMGAHRIVDHLNKMGIKPRKAKRWMPETIYDILENDHCAGYVRWNRRKEKNIVDDGEIIKTRPRMSKGDFLLYDGKHEAIISKELFHAAAEKRGKNPHTKSKVKVRNPLAGLLFCHCGKAMSYRTYTKNGVARSAPRLLCDSQTYCKTSSCLFDEVIDMVAKTLQESIDDFEVKIKNNSDANLQEQYENHIQRLKNKLHELEQRELSQWEAQADPDPSNRMPQHIFQKLNEKLLKEKEEVQDALRVAYDSMPKPIDYKERLCTFKKALDALKNPTISAEEKNMLLKSCIDRIEYKREKSVMLTSKGKFGGGANWSSPPIELDIHLRL